MAASEETISLRPLSLRPGAGVNPFANFAQGAGVGLKKKVCPVVYDWICTNMRAVDYHRVILLMRSKQVLGR